MKCLNIKEEDPKSFQKGKRQFTYKPQQSGLQTLFHRTRGHPRRQSSKGGSEWWLPHHRRRAAPGEVQALRGAERAPGGQASRGGAGGEKADPYGDPGGRGGGSRATGAHRPERAGGQRMTREMRGRVTERKRMFKNTMKCVFLDHRRKKESRNASKKKKKKQPNHHQYATVKNGSRANGM